VNSFADLWVGLYKNRDLHRNWDKGDYKFPLTKLRIANPDQPGKSGLKTLSVNI
jgi:hypothetical protein